MYVNGEEEQGVGVKREEDGVSGIWRKGGEREREKKRGKPLDLVMQSHKGDFVCS